MRCCSQRRRPQTRQVATPCRVFQIQVWHQIQVSQIGPLRYGFIDTKRSRNVSRTSWECLYSLHLFHIVQYCRPCRPPTQRLHFECQIAWSKTSGPQAMLAQTFPSTRFKTKLLLLVITGVMLFPVSAKAAESLCMWSDGQCLYVVTGEPGGEGTLYVNCGGGYYEGGTGTFGSCPGTLIP